MSLQGPIVVIAGQKNPDLADALAAAGAFPVIESSWSDAADAIARIEPAAVVMDAPKSPPRPPRRGPCGPRSTPPVVPMCRWSPGSPTGHAGNPARCRSRPMRRRPDRDPARFGVAGAHPPLRRRSAGDALEGECGGPSGPAGQRSARGRHRDRHRPRPDLSGAHHRGRRGGRPDRGDERRDRRQIPHRARHRRHRDRRRIHPLTIEAFLTVLAEDTRFRDLPIALLPGLPRRDRPEPPAQPGTSRRRPAEIVARILPLVRQHAFEARLQRQLAALEAKACSIAKPACSRRRHFCSTSTASRRRQEPRATP